MTTDSTREGERRDDQDPDEVPEEELDESEDLGELPQSARAPAEPFDPSSLGEKGRLAFDILTGLLERMGMDARVVGATEDESVHIDVGGPDSGRVIGKKGQTLDALQFLVNKVVNRFPDDRKHVVVDVEGYRERRDDSLASLARRLGEKANRTGKVITISPMPSRERRVIHLALANVPGLTTRSDGEGSERRVRIIPQKRPVGPRR